MRDIRNFLNRSAWMRKDNEENKETAKRSIEPPKGSESHSFPGLLGKHIEVPVIKRDPRFKESFDPIKGHRVGRPRKNLHNDL